MVTVDGLHGDSVVDDLFSSGGDLQTFFDQLLQGLDAAASRGGEGAEEELEWLSNKDAFPAVEDMDLEPAVIGGPRTNVMRPRRRAQEELEWLSNKDLLPTVEEMEQEPAVMGPRTRVVRRRRGAMPSIPPMAARPGQRRCGLCGTTKTPQWRRGPAGCRTCNACGVRYESERPELHSNMHRRIVEFCAGLASGGGGEAELEWPSNEDASPAPGTMEPEPSVVGSPTKRAVRHRRTLAWPPTEAEPGQRWCQHCGKMKKPQWHEAAVEVEREWLPNKNVPAVEVMEPKPSVASPALCDLGQRLCGHCGTTETPQWRGGGGGGAEGRKTLCNACGVRYRTGRLVPEYRPLRSLAFSPELHSSRHRCVAQMKKPQWREGAAMEQERENKNVPAVETMELKPSVVAPRTEGVARRAVASPALSDLGQRLCRHCGTAETPQWREGPEGRKTLCNACGVRYRAGRLVPEYRPLSSPTFSPELHSNRHSRVAQMRSARAPHLHFLPPDK